MITKSDIGLEEAVETLTGFEEQFIHERFGADVEELLMQRPRDGLRAVAAVLVARAAGGDKDGAFQHVMGLSIRAVNDFFPEDEAEAMPEEPDTESGKDVSADAK